MTEFTPLLDLDDALALWDWGWNEFEQERDPSWRSRASIVGGLVDVLAFTACQLALHGHHGWIVKLPELIKINRGFFLDDDSGQDRCLEALADLLHYGAPIGKVVKALARDRNPAVRAALAQGLRATDPDARELLELLATDANASVRKLARERLPAGQPAAWWIGKFASDPVPRLPEANDEQLAALRTVALFVDRDRAQQEATLLEFGAALKLLPTPILFEFVARVVDFAWLAPGFAPMLAELLRRPAGAAKLWDMLVSRLNRPHEWAHLWFVLVELGKRIDAPLREPLCRGLLERLVEQRHSKIAGQMSQICQGVFRDLWPESLPGVLVLDAWETLAGDAPTLAADLESLLADVDLRSEFGRLFALAEQHEGLVHALGATVARLEPEPREAFVVRGLASANDRIRALALAQLASAPADPSPGASQAAFERYWADPALRRAIIGNAALSENFCPQLRRQLAAGELSLHETAKILSAIGRLWGGVESPDTDEQRAERLARARAWHQDAGELGPVTEQEWARWRALRWQELDEHPDAHPGSLFAVRPPGPIDPDAHAIIERLMTRWREEWAARDPEKVDEALVFRALALCLELPSAGKDEFVLAQLDELVAVLREFHSPLLDVAVKNVEELRKQLDEG